MEKGQMIDIYIEDLTIDGQGIGRYDGLTIFVSGVTLGDTVRAVIAKKKKRYAIAKLEKIIKYSEHRIANDKVCTYVEKCGGCAFGELDYQVQLELKEKQLRDKLTRIGGIVNPKVKEIIGMERPYRYRNKAQFQISTGGIITRKGGIVENLGEAKIGFYEQKTHDVIDCADCPLQTEISMSVADALREFMAEDNITAYDPKWEKGLMRNLIVKVSVHTGEVMVILIVNGKGIPNAQKLVEMIDEAIYNSPINSEGRFSETEFYLKSVIININTSKNQQGSIIGEKCITLAGSSSISDILSVNDINLKFEISPLAFYQVNSLQTVRLYEKVLEYACLTGNEIVLDLYCGVGTIGLFCAADMVKKAGNGKVIGIESVKGAVIDANRNSVINNIVNTRYVCGKAEDELPFMLGLKKLYKYNDVNELVERQPDIVIDKADVVILDPPRAGCDIELLNAVAQVSPARVVYVSCDAATLARDLKVLIGHGYEFVEATPVDMFPHTGHVECIALLTKVHK